MVIPAFRLPQVPQEPLYKVAYGTAMFTKARQLYFVISNVASDITCLLNSDITTVFIQMQAALAPWLSQANAPPSTSLTSNLTSQFYKDWAPTYHSFKQLVNDINTHPLTVMSRKFFFIKQSCDFTIASIQWLKGNRTNQSMLFHSVNTALAVLPMMIASLPTNSYQQITANVVLLGCLAYSIRKDYLHSTLKQPRESSPCIHFIQNNLIPKIKVASAQLFG